MAHLHIMMVVFTKDNLQIMILMETESSLGAKILDIIMTIIKDNLKIITSKGDLFMIY